MQDAILRAGSLAKCDLATQMVGEFPELQGHVGKLYAENQGESKEVALAIEEAWLPRFAEDVVAKSPVGIALAIADRVDALVGCFGVGIIPKSGGDPQGLRRAAQGLLRTIVENEMRVDLRELFILGVEHFHNDVVRQAEKGGLQAWTKARGQTPGCKDQDTLVGDLVEFVIARFRANSAATADIVEAVTSISAPDPLVLQRKVDALAGLSGQPDFGEIMVTFKRVSNITRDIDFPAPSRGELTHDTERALLDAVERAEGEISAAADKLDFRAALERMLVLRKPIADLFDAVMVDDPEHPNERAVRMGLLLRVRRSFHVIADFSKISNR